MGGGGLEEGGGKGEGEETFFLPLLPLPLFFPLPLSPC